MIYQEIGLEQPDITAHAHMHAHTVILGWFHSISQPFHWSFEKINTYSGWSFLVMMSEQEYGNGHIEYF